LRNSNEVFKLSKTAHWNPQPTKILTQGESTSKTGVPVGFFLHRDGWEGEGERLSILDIVQYCYNLLLYLWQFQNSILLGVSAQDFSSSFPAQARSMTPSVDSELKYFFTSEGVERGKLATYAVAAPVTRGVAIDVPFSVMTALGDPIQAEVMNEPGARISTHGPKLEKDDRKSESCLVRFAKLVAPTVITASTCAGEKRQAFMSSFPAATTTVIPDATATSTASSMAWLLGPLTDISERKRSLIIHFN
jgi:hypothetical protein